MELSTKQLKEVLQKVTTQPTWDFSALSQACQQTLDAAEKEAIYLTIATLDVGGQLNFLYRHPKALFISLELAQKKAYSAFAMNMDTSLLQQLTQPNASLYQLESSTNGKLVTFAGGISTSATTPTTLSAIGVSGSMDSSDDERFAKLFWTYYQKLTH